jgi:hypothetical protein
LGKLLALSLGLVACCTAAVAASHTKPAVEWSEVAGTDIAKLQDDDLIRHAAEPDFLGGVSVSETRFSEAGFNWHLLRFVNAAKPVGPLWVVPHDDENAAFDSAIAALKTHGGVAIVVNSGSGSSRTQSGQGTCGGRAPIITRCDPNRNFSSSTPLFTSAHLDQRASGQPVIALHTNSPGFGPGKGEITILDAAAASKGKIRPRKNGYFGIAGPAVLKDHDSYAIIPFAAPKFQEYDVRCRKALVEAGVHVWHEAVGKSDGSFSNYAVLEKADMVYVNMESRREANLAVASERHRLMVDAYLKGCSPLGN